MLILHQDDCLNVDVKDVKLIYLDPPYSSKTEDSYYGVGDTFDEYLSYMKARFDKLKTCLHQDSNIIIHVDFKAVHYLKVEADKVFGRTNFQNEIIWCYTSPSVAKTHLPRKHDTLLWYGMGKFPFNQPYVPYNKSLNVGGKTGWKKKTDTTQYIDRGKKLEDFWTDIPALCRNEKEKLGYPTQKPLKLMKRIVESFSNENDVVYDPFAGSGSFLEAAKELNRQPIGADVSSQAIDLIRTRLA